MHTSLTNDFGGHSDRVTPVPIPNTEVKPVSADGTWGLTPWESRTPPDFARWAPPHRGGAHRRVWGPAVRAGLVHVVTASRFGDSSTTWTPRSLERPAYDARHEWAATGQGAAGRHADVPVLVDRGGVADADEQPRPRGGRAPRRPRGVRGDGPGGALVGGIRRDLRHAHDARRRRDDARPVRQAGRRVPHQRVGAPRAHRQLQPRARLGQLERVPPARGARADDVRPDDGRARGSTSARRASCKVPTSASPRSPGAASRAHWPARSRSPPASAAWAGLSRWRSR